MTLREVMRFFGIPTTELLAPTCRCGEPCRFYSPMAGYSVCCAKCNEKNALRQRNARKLKRTKEAQ